MKGIYSQPVIPTTVAVPCPKESFRYTAGHACMDCDRYAGVLQISAHKDWEQANRIICRFPILRSIQEMVGVDVVQCPKTTFKFAPVVLCKSCAYCEGFAMVRKRNLFGFFTRPGPRKVKCAHEIARRVDAIVAFDGVVARGA